ncbi:unnamed protein product [Ectocarpus sp. 12 AP-2014]
MKARSLPKPSGSEAKKNRARRVEKMAEANQKRRAAVKKQKKQRQDAELQIQMEKDYVRAEKKRLRDELRKAREKIAMEKKKLRKPAKPVVKCSPDEANQLSIAMSRLVPTSAEISNFTHAQCTKLRSDTSKILSGIRAYAKRCSPNYGVKKKRSTPVARRSTPPLNFAPHEVYIPDIGYNVPDEIPVTERAFYEARERLRKKSKSGKKSSAKNKVRG